MNEEVTELHSGDELLLCESRLKKINCINKVYGGLQPGCVGSMSGTCSDRTFSRSVYLDCRL